MLAISRSAADVSFSNDQLDRRWANVHGEVYVPITAQTLLITYGGIWAIGILGLCVFQNRLQCHLSNLKRSEEE